MGTLNRTILVGLFFCFIRLVSFGQPVHHTGKEINGILVYQDLLNKNKYYYEAAELEIGTNEDGSPKFRYLKMANSVMDKAGSGALLKDFNLIQIGLFQATIPAERLQRIKIEIGGEVDLVPIPVDKMEFVLLGAARTAGKANKIGDHLNASDETLKSGSWEGKNITIRLSKAGAALVDHHLKNEENIGMSYSYSYFADFVTGMGEQSLKGNQELNLPALDTSIHKIAYKSDLLELKIDLKKWGDQCIEEIVLNEETLPRYLPIQVFCYDFSDDLRPDLILKKVEVCGDGLQGLESCIQLEFSNQKRRENAHSLRFKLPVVMTKPLRYKVTEISKLNGLQQSAWINIQPGASINITTPEQEQVFDNQILDIEVDFEEMKVKGFHQAKIELSFQLHQESKRKDISINSNKDIHFLSTNFFYDKGTPIKYKITWVGDKDVLSVENSKILDGDFIYLKP